MKINNPLIIIALIFNLVNLLMWRHLSTMPNATSMVYLVIYPIFWILTMILVGILAFRNRKKWFEKSFILFTILALVFCTPFPILLISKFEEKDYYLASTTNYPENGSTFRIEEWNYTTGDIMLIKYWKTNVDNCNMCDSSVFKKDSTWTYFDRKGDTIRLEYYKDGRLIKVITKNK